MENEFESFGPRLQEDERNIENVERVVNGYNIVWSEYWKLVVRNQRHNWKYKNFKNSLRLRKLHS